jgi:hypothetical protein
VISCALALLAAQPVVAQASAAASKPVLLRDAGVLGSSNFLEAAVTRQSASGVVGPRRQDSFLASARRLHLLATVEILQRLLIIELRGAGIAGEHAGAPAFGFDQVCIEILPPASAVPTPSIPSNPPALQVAEVYAITRCLLAPPLA